MKRVLAIFLMFALVMSFVKPGVSLAAIKEADLKEFIEEEAIFEDVEEFENYYYYYFYEYHLDELSSIEELKEILGEKLTPEKVEEIALDYGFNDREELADMLLDYGELEEGSTIEETYIYTNALTDMLEFNEETQTPITEETLNELLAEYEMTLEELKQLLAENGDSLDNYQYIEDLEAAIMQYTSYDFIQGSMEEIGLTEAEVEKVAKHILSIDLEDPAIEQRLEALLNRMEQIPEFESASELTQAQLAEIASIYTELLDIFQMKAQYYLIKNGEKTPLSLNELLVLETTNGADLLIELYSKSGEFLADVILTAELFGSDLIEEVKVIAKPITNPIANPEKAPAKKVKKTVKGGKLPNTAGNYAEGILFGLVLVGAGSMILIRRKRAAA